MGPVGLSSKPRKSCYRRDKDRKGDRGEEEGVDGGGGEGGEGHKLQNYYLRKAPAVPPAKRRKAGRVVTDSKYGRQPPRGPSGQLNNFSLTGAAQHLFAIRRSIINRLMWISNLLPRLTWWTWPGGVTSPLLKQHSPPPTSTSLAAVISIWCSSQVLFRLFGWLARG